MESFPQRPAATAMPGEARVARERTPIECQPAAHADVPLPIRSYRNAFRRRTPLIRIKSPGVAATRDARRYPDEVGNRDAVADVPVPSGCRGLRWVLSLRQSTRSWRSARRRLFRSGSCVFRTSGTTCVAGTKLPAGGGCIVDLLEPTPARSGRAGPGAARARTGAASSSRRAHSPAAGEAILPVAWSSRNTRPPPEAPEASCSPASPRVRVSFPPSRGDQGPKGQAAPRFTTRRKPNRWDPTRRSSNCSSVIRPNGANRSARSFSVPRSTPRRWSPRTRCRAWAAWRRRSRPT